MLIRTGGLREFFGEKVVILGSWPPGRMDKMNRLGLGLPRRFTLRVKLLAMTKKDYKCGARTSTVIGRFLKTGITAL